MNDKDLLRINEAISSTHKINFQRHIFKFDDIKFNEIATPAL